MAKLMNETVGIAVNVFNEYLLKFTKRKKKQNEIYFCHSINYILHCIFRFIFCFVIVESPKILLNDTRKVLTNFQKFSQ